MFEVSAGASGTATNLTVKQGPAGDFYVTDGTNVWWSADGAYGSFSYVTDASVEWVEGLPVAENFTYQAYRRVTPAQATVTGNVLSFTNYQDFSTLPAGSEPAMVTVPGGTNAGSVITNAQGNPAWTSQIQVQTNGFTGAASLPAVSIPATVAGQAVTGARVVCEEWSNVSGTWRWEPISSQDVAVTDTRPGWCQDATRDANGNQRSFLQRGERLEAGQWLISQNCQWGLTVQATDGNVVLYQLNPTANTLSIVGAAAATEQFHREFGAVPSTLVFGADGNVVQYIGALPGAGSASNSVAWTGTQNSGWALFVQNDGNVVIYQSGTPANPSNPVWARFGLANSNGGGQVPSSENNSPNHFFALNG